MRGRLLLCLVVLAAAWPPAAAAAPPPLRWCGTDSVATDRVPEAVAGEQIHVIYAIPAEGPDRFAELASPIVTDLAAVDAWWRSQDPARAPRFDLFDFPGCEPGLGRLDLSSVRLPRTAAAYAGDRFEGIRQDLGRTFSDPGKKYLVLYDGLVEPADDQQECGRAAVVAGGGPAAYAVIYLRSACDDPGTGVDVAWSMAHELLHVLDALPRPRGGAGPPHACPRDDGHPCDHQSDILYPAKRGGVPLVEQLLDAGRDDYYGHSGPWFDVQDSRWLSNLDAPRFPFSVTLRGRGSVSSTAPGIACPPACSIEWEGGTLVRLLATAEPGFRLVGWSGDCTGAGVCDLRADAPRNVVALFGPATFRVRVAVSGKGRVTSPDVALACPPVCSELADAARPVALRARAARGWRFAGWGGSCRGRARCVLRPGATRSVRARFTRR